MEADKVFDAFKNDSCSSMWEEGKEWILPQVLKNARESCKSAKSFRDIKKINDDLRQNCRKLDTASFAAKYLNDPDSSASMMAYCEKLTGKFEGRTEGFSAGYKTGVSTCDVTDKRTPDEQKSAR